MPFLDGISHLGPKSECPVIVAVKTRSIVPGSRRKKKEERKATTHQANIERIVICSALLTTSFSLEESTMSEFISGTPLTLRCGLRLPNRLVKASMSENIHTLQSLPNAKICIVYRRWDKGGWGMLITGMFYA
jgi:hypothetical protein